MAKISVSPFLIEKLDLLTTILYQKEYFGFVSSAEEYVNKIYDFIFTIPKQTLLHNCIKPNYGKHYAICKMNAHTTYYITYDFENEYYLMKNIFTNHEKEYTLFIK